MTSEELADRYIEAWNQVDDHQRRTLLAELFVPAGTYVDPLMEGAGLDGLNEMITAARQQIPGLSFRRQGAVDTHHEVLRFSWVLVAEGGGVAAQGMDVLTLRQGRFGSVVGFLEPVVNGV